MLRACVSFNRVSLLFLFFLPSQFLVDHRDHDRVIDSIFRYMRLKGVPANKITLLTTYNGQKALLRDVINQRCGGNALFGYPQSV